MTLSSSLGRRLATCVAGAALALTSSLALSPSASANPRTGPCIWPSTGTDLQQYFGVSTTLVVPTRGCGTVLAGSSWSTPAVFYVARSWEHIPAGITPIGATPLEELQKRLVRFRLFVDEGTPQAFTVDRSASQLQYVTQPWQVLFPNDPDWLLVDIGTHITLRPLPPGQHTVRGEFEVTGPTCDGTSDDVDQSCIPTGVFEFPPTRTFQVQATS